MYSAEQREWRSMIDRYSAELLAQYNKAEHNESSTEIVTSEYFNETTLPDIGQLQVRVSTEDQAVPIVGAVVTVQHNFGNGDILDKTMITGESGLTPLIDLPTKDRALSLSPGNPSPFTEYSIEVSADGYFTKTFRHLPVYGGVTAIQSVTMLPLPEFSEDDIAIVYDESAEPTL